LGLRLMLWRLFVCCLYFVGFVIANKLSQDYVVTPAGWRHRSCVVEVPSGSSVELMEDGNVVIEFPMKKQLQVKRQYLPSCKYPAYDFAPPRGDFCSTTDPTANCQYTNYAYWVANRNVLSFNGSWNVPVLPADRKNNYAAYYWTGLWNTQTSALIQPVMGWDYVSGSYGAGCWYVIGASGYVVHSNFIPVAQNDNGYGWMYKMGDSADYMVYYEDTTTRAATYLIAKNAGPFNAGLVVHEQWYQFSCSAIPNTGTINFSGLVLSSTPSWTPGGTHSMNSCGESMSILNSQNIVFRY